MSVETPKPTVKAPVHRDVKDIDKEILIFSSQRYIIAECQTCGSEEKYNPGTSVKEIATEAFEHVCS